MYCQYCLDMSYQFSTKSLEWSMHFCQCCMRNLFQHLTTSCAQLPGLHCHSHSSALLWSFKDWIGCLGGPSLDCMVVVGTLPSHSLQLSLMSDMRCEVVHCHVGWQSLSSDDLHKVHITFFVVSEHSVLCWWFPLLTSMHHSSQKTVPCNIAGWGYSSGLWRCHVMPSHALFNFWVEVVEPTSSPVMMCMKASPVAVCHWSNCVDTFMQPFSVGQ